MNGTQTPKTDPFTPTIGIATTTTAVASLWGQKKTCFVKAKKGKKGKVLFSVTESLSINCVCLSSNILSCLAKSNCFFFAYQKVTSA